MALSYKYPCYIPCASTTSVPTILKRAAGASTFSVEWQATGGPGGHQFTDMHGITTPTTVYLAACGSLQRKFGGIIAQSPVFAVKDGNNAWQEIASGTYPANFVFTSCFVSAPSVVYLSGAGTGGGVADGIFRWTPGGGFVRVLDTAADEVIKMHGSGPTNIIASTVGGNFFRSIDGTNFVSIGGPGGVPIRGIWATGTTEIYGVGSGGAAKLGRWTGAWAELGNWGGANALVMDLCEFNGICLMPVWRTGISQDTWRWTSAGGLAIVDPNQYFLATGFDGDGKAIVVGGNWGPAVYWKESPDYGITWQNSANLAGYTGGYQVFFLLDTEGPIVTPTSPLKSTSGITTDAEVQFNITGAPVDPWTVEIDRGRGWEAVLTYNAGAVFEAVFSGPNSAVSSITGGYSVIIDPISPFIPGQVVQVQVTAEDTYGNPATIA